MLSVTLYLVFYPYSSAFVSVILSGNIIPQTLSSEISYPYSDTLPVKIVVSSHLLAFSEITHGDYYFILSFTMSFLLALHLSIKKYIFIYFWPPRDMVVVFGLSSCPAARGMVIPQPEIEPTSRALEGRFLTTGPPGKSLALPVDCS